MSATEPPAVRATGSDRLTDAVVAVTRLVCGVPEKVTRRHVEALVAAGSTDAGQPPAEPAAIVADLRRITASLADSPSAQFNAHRATAPAADLVESGGGPPDPARVNALAAVIAEVALQVDRRDAPPTDVHAPPHLPPRQLASWQALVEVAEEHPEGWVLIGGQMVALHCWERGATPSRPTNDGDAVLDVRASPEVLRTFTETLVALDFEGGTPTATGHELRWHRARDGAQIDVLIPEGVGARASDRRGAGGGTTLATPGADDALRQSRPVRVHLTGRAGVVRRPHLTGAVLLKGRAARVPLDPGRARHLLDAAILLGLLGSQDRADLRHLLWQPGPENTARGLLADLANSPLTWMTEEQSAARGIAVLEAALRQAPGKDRSGRG